MSVNLSPADVTDLQLPDRLAACAARHGLPLRALTVEIIEDTLMDDPERARTVLLQLRQRGIGVSIDDYGTGYSSLAYLRRLPADELKLDPALVVDVATDVRAGAIARHTIALAHALGLRVVAEGVEDGATVDALAAMGCDAVQGFWIARAMPVDAFVSWLRRRSPDASARLASVPQQRAGVAVLV